MRNERLGNACLWALIHLPDGGGVPYLARLLSRVKYPKVKRHRGGAERGGRRGRHHPR
jgi:hypothetical protein